MSTASSREAAPLAILQLVDTLAVGGLERLARDLANLLPRAQFAPHLCTTRATGPLAEGLDHDVGTLHLARRFRYDLLAFRRLARWVRQRDIRLVHAHGHAVHAAIVSTVTNPRVAVIWHLHSGAWAEMRQPGLPLRIAARRVGHIFTVTEALADWCRSRLGVPADRVEYVPNFLGRGTGPCKESSQASSGDHALTLPGEPGRRLICVANLRPEKDIPVLIEAMRLALRQDPRLHLLLVGGGTREAHEGLARALGDAKLDTSITALGHRDDVPALLRASDVAVLASRSEGFPLVLLEYGAAGLPTVATRVGQCAEILDHGEAGILTAPGDPSALAAAILRAFAPESRRLGEKLRARVSSRYVTASILERITTRYRHLAGSIAP